MVPEVLVWVSWSNHSRFWWYSTTCSENAWWCLVTSHQSGSKRKRDCIVKIFFRGSPSPKSNLSLTGPISYGFCPDLSRCEPVDKDFETWAFMKHYRQNYVFKILIIEWHIFPAGNTWCFLSKSLLGCCFVSWRQTGAIWEDWHFMEKLPS